MGTTYANAAHRCQLLEHCIAEYILLYDRAEEGKPAITVGHWESQQSTFEDFDVVAMSLLAEMREFYREIRGVSSIKVMYVCGEDHAEKCFLSRGFAHPDIGVVIIPRESPSRRACIIESNPARNVYIASATDRSGMNFSSTELRLALASLILDSENDLRNSRPAQIFGLSCLEYCRLNHVYLPPPEGIRIVHISDTHNFLVDASSLQLPPGDVLVHTGDFSNSGTVEGKSEFIPSYTFFLYF
jgi:hypothetical protein